MLDGCTESNRHLITVNYLTEKAVSVKRNVLVGIVKSLLKSHYFSAKILLLSESRIFRILAY